MTTTSNDPLLAEVAALALEWSKTLCTAGGASDAGCDWYHGAWPALRLVGSVSGAKGDERFFQDAFSRLGLPHAPRVLITGAADHAMLEQVVTGLHQPGDGPYVTVVDHCRTALEVNRWYAERVEAKLETIQADILDVPHAGRFDLVTTHSILSFIPHEKHRALFLNWRRCLKTGGYLVTSQALRPGYRGPDLRTFSETEVDAFVERVRVDVLARPRSETQFLVPHIDVLARRFAAHKQAYVVTDLEKLASMLEECGFCIESSQAISRAEISHRAASPDKATEMSNARIIARAT